MAEAYITTDLELTIPSLSIQDFEGELCFKQALECFYDPRSKTGVMCKFELRVQELTKPILINFVKTSDPQLHAEQLFCKKAKEGLQRNRSIHTPTAVYVTMLVSNSPCSKCREDLQALFISCDVPNVCFTLRIARLYLEKSTPDEAERKLDYWIKDLEARKIRVCLSAINVIPEIAMLTKKVSSMNDEQRSTRIYEDTKIKRQIDNIQNGTTHVTKLIKHFKLVWSGFTRTYFIDESDEQMILLQLIVSGVTRTEQRPTEIRESHKVDGDGDHLFEKAIHEIKTRIPLSWGSIRKCLVLVCAHVPSTKCQERITEFLGEKKLDRVKNKLVLYIAKVPVGKERRNFIEWIEHLEGNLIDVCLQPFYAPFPSLSGQIIDQYVILKTEFQTLKRELESRMSPPLSETQSPQSFSPDSDEDMSS